MDEERELPRRTATEIVLMILAALSALALIGMLLLYLPYAVHPGDDPEDPQLRHEHSTTESGSPSEDPQGTPESTLPPPAANPYGRNDFQYNSQNYLTCLAGDSVNGIDVSYYQKDIDWEQVRQSGIEFAIVRVGFRGYGKAGRLVEDEYYEKNIEGALEAGLDVGVYMFSQAITVEEAEEEARFLLERIAKYDITMPVVYDWEEVEAEDARTNNMDARTLTDCTLRFCQVVEEAGYEAMVYFNRNQGSKLLYLEELTQYPFWLAAYTDRMPYPYRVEIWQYTDRGRVPGIQGGVDINVMFYYP